MKELKRSIDNVEDKYKDDDQVEKCKQMKIEKISDLEILFCKLTNEYQCKTLNKIRDPIMNRLIQINEKYFDKANTNISKNFKQFVDFSIQIFKKVNLDFFLV